MAPAASLASIDGLRSSTSMEASTQPGDDRVEGNGRDRRACNDPNVLPTGEFHKSKRFPYPPLGPIPNHGIPDPLAGHDGHLRHVVCSSGDAQNREVAEATAVTGREESIEILAGGQALHGTGTAGGRCPPAT
jgi:hypothetical protein